MQAMTNFDDQFEAIVRSLRASLDEATDELDALFTPRVNQLLADNDVRKAGEWRDEAYYQSLEG